MSGDFAKKWQKEDQPLFKERVQSAVRPPPPLKPRLDSAVRSLQSQIYKMTEMHRKLSERDKVIFQKVVASYAKHDSNQAQVYANELVEIRKMAKLVLQARLALEQIVLRLSTVQELGDVVTILAPAMSIVRGVKAGISGVLPEAEGELGSIGEVLGSLLVDAGQTGGLNIDFQAAGEDAQLIMREAATVAEQRVKENFPELPTAQSMPSGQNAPTA